MKLSTYTNTKSLDSINLRSARKLPNMYIWPLSFLPKFHRGHSNSKSLYTGPGEDCIETGTWVSWDRVPKAELDPTQLLGLAAIPSTTSSWQKESLRKSDLPQVHNFLPGFQVQCWFLPRIRMQKLNQDLVSLGFL